MDCSVAQCLEIVGERWSLLIIRDALLGISRFDDFQRRLGISRNILDARLNQLVDAGIMKRVPYSDRPPRSAYRLTAMGRDLWPVVTAMRQWGDRYAAPSGPPIQLRHRECGAIVDVINVCGSCRQHLTVHDVEAVAGPGRRDPSSIGASGISPDAT